jgi:hypothetical protein
MNICRAICLTFLLVSVSLGDELRTLSGKSIVGAVTAIGDSEIVVKTDKGEEKVPLAQVLAIDLRPVKGIGADKYSDVRLLDDTILHCTKVAFKGKEVQLGLPSGVAMTLSVNYVTSILHGAQDAALRKKWDEMLAQRGKKDRIVIAKGGELNALEGTFGEVDAEGKTIQFRRETGDVLPINLERLDGMIFHRLEAPRENPICKVLDSQGNSLMAVKVASDGKGFVVTTAFGPNIHFAREDLARFDFNMGKLTYLSDMEPAKVVEKSLIGLVIHYRKDVNLDGETIMLGGQSHAKGLSLHAHTELEYNLDGKYKEFKAVLGVDPRIGGDSQPQVTILCDGEKRFSEVVTAKANRAVAVNVKDVTTLKIVVSSRNALDLHDHVTIAEARVSQ